MLYSSCVIPNMIGLDIKQRQVWTDLPGLVCTIRQQRADQQLLAISSGNMKRSVSIHIDAVNLPACVRREEET